MRARGTITGLTRGSGIEHIIRAALESIAYQTNDLLCAMATDIGKNITKLRVDGGASANNFLMQFQADISNTVVLRPSMGEATAAGAAFLAGLAVGFFKDKDEISSLLANVTEFSPSMTSGEREKLLTGWKKAIIATKATSSEP